MADIEDAFSHFAPKKVNDIIKVIRRSDAGAEPFSGDSFLPESYSIFIRTWGCAHNTSDSEYMTGLLTAAGYRITSSKDSASLWLLNSCTVKTPSEMQLSHVIKEAAKSGKHVVVAGCVSQADPSFSNSSVIGVKQIDRIVEVVEETLKGNCVRLLSRKRKNQSLFLPKIRKNKYVEILAVNSGCLNHCTYCKTKLARGDLVSYIREDLLEQAKTAFAEGCKEIWLTSEDLGAWGRDIGMVLPDLLYSLVEIIPEGCMMRLGMTNPPYILDFLEDIAAVLNHPRVYSFLHIPVQSASDAVLRDMKREYSYADFCRVVDFMLENVPNIYIATDFICAFPTETAEDFEESLKLVEKYRFPSLFINQFYPRSGTPAARLKKINTIEARSRTSRMSSLFKSYTRYTADRIGEIHKVLVCERATDGIHYVGHNKSYEHILFLCDDSSIMGSVLNVKITDVSKFHMKAVLLERLDSLSNKDLECSSKFSELSFFNYFRTSKGSREDRVFNYGFALITFLISLLLWIIW